LRAWKKNLKSSITEIQYQYIEFVTKHLSFTPYNTGLGNLLVLVSIQTSEYRPDYYQFEIQKKNSKKMTTEVRYKKPLMFLNVPTMDPKLAHQQSITSMAEYLSTTTPIEKLSSITDELLVKLPMVVTVRPSRGALLASPMVVHDAPMVSVHQVQLVYEYEYFRTKGNCVICFDQDVSVVKHHLKQDCGVMVCYKCYSKSINIYRQNRPVKCPYCREDLPIASPSGPTGFHYAYVSGTSTEEVREYFSPVLDRPFNSFHCDQKFVDEASAHIKDYFISRIGSKLRIFDMLDPYHYDMAFPNKGSAGFFYGAANGKSVTKREAFPHIHRTIMAIMDIVYRYLDNDAYDAAYDYLNRQFVNVCKMHFKVEIRCPERVNGEWVKKEKGRIFFISDFLSYLIAKPFIAPLAAICGTNPIRNCPIAIGMRFDSGVCTEFLLDLVGIQYDQFVNSMNATTLCEFVMEKRRIIEFDFRKFDVHLLAQVLVISMNIIFSLFDCPSTFEECTTNKQKMFFLVTIQFLNTLIAKVVNVPDGRGWFKFVGLMLSGKYETAFLNSVCNWFMTICVFMKIYSVPVVVEALNNGELRFKMFGDDNLTVVGPTMYESFDSDRFIAVMHQMFGMVITPDNIIVHNHLFRNCCGFVGAPVHKYPTFLKYAFMYRNCPDHGAESYFFRDTDLSLPKLFNTAVHVATPPFTAAKALCFAYTSGCNIEVYDACAAVYYASRQHCTQEDIIEYFDNDINLVKKAKEFALDYKAIKRFPTHSEVIERFSCPKIKEDPVFRQWDEFRLFEVHQILYADYGVFDN